jgi:hypothetical protein
MCDGRVDSDRASRSASSRHCTYPFYSSSAGFFSKASHHPGLSAPLQPRFGSLPLLSFPKVKIAVEREEICECDGHTVHKRSQWRLTADWLAPRESDCSRMHSKVFSDWLPSYIKATRPVLEIFKMAGYFPDRPRIVLRTARVNVVPVSNKQLSLSSHSCSTGYLASETDILIYNWCCAFANEFPSRLKTSTCANRVPSLRRQ